jgi:Fe2+ or Zn2+ uptake regulation protein
VAQMKGEMGREHGFEVEGAEIHLTGRCSQCRQQEGAAR